MGENGQGRLPAYLAPIAADAAARRQYSFSRLSGQLHARTAGGQSTAGDGETAPEPSLDPKGLGTLVHAVLAEIDFARPGDVTGVVRRLAEQHLPGAADSLGEPIEMVRRFLASPRAAELAAASEVHRELEFLLAWPPGENAAAAGRASQNAATGGRASQNAATGGRAKTRRPPVPQMVGATSGRGFVGSPTGDICKATSTVFIGILPTNGGCWTSRPIRSVRAKLRNQRRPTSCKCSCMPWRSRRFSVLRRPNWRRASSAPVWNITSPGRRRPAAGDRAAKCRAPIKPRPAVAPQGRDRWSRFGRELHL